MHPGRSNAIILSANAPRALKRYNRRLGVETGAERMTPTGNPSPAPTHPHRTHDTTDQWREIRLVARPILDIFLRFWVPFASNVQ